MMNKGFTVWFTGITCSGKSTLATMLCDSLNGFGLQAESLDSGKLRREFNQELGYSREAIEANLKRLTYDCRMLNRNGVVAIVAAISPYKELRDDVRRQIRGFVEVHCDATVDELQERDGAGIFEKARRGELRKVAGVSFPYEPPDRPEVHLKTAQETPERCLETILKTLEILGHIPATRTSAYTPAEETMIKNRLRGLGYI